MVIKEHELPRFKFQLHSCVTMGKSLNLSEPHVDH